MDNINHCHHEQHLGVQAAFMKDVRSLTAVFEDWETLFLRKAKISWYLIPGITWTLL